MSHRASRFGRRGGGADDHTVPDHDLDDEGGGAIRELIVTFVLAVGLAFLLQQFLVKPYRIPSGSMENTLRCKDRVLVDRLSYRFHDPRRFDVVVFHPPAGVGEGGAIDPSVVSGLDGVPADFNDGAGRLKPADTTYIKRIIGMPGEDVVVKDHRAYVDGKRLEEPFLHPIIIAAGQEAAAEFGPVHVPKGAYLALGDNRTHSADGRSFGWLPRDFIIGRAFSVYWPPRRFGGLPEKDSGRTAEVDSNCLEAGSAATPDGGTASRG